MPTSIQFIKQAWPIYTKHAGRFASLYLIFLGIIVLSFTIAVASAIVPILGPLIAIPLVLLTGGLLFAVFQILVINIVDKKAIDTKSLFSYGWQSMFAVTTTLLLMVIFMALGFALFIIPGIILTVWYAFVVIEAVKKEQSAMDSIRASIKQVRLASWQVAHFIFLGTVFTMIIGLVPLLGGLVNLFVVYPTLAIAEYLQYKKVTALKQKQPATSRLIASVIALVIAMILFEGLVFSLSSDQVFFDFRGDFKSDFHFGNNFVDNLDKKLQLN